MKQNTIKFSTVFQISLLVTFALVFLLPLLMIVMASLKTSSEVFSAPFSLPNNAQFQNYVQAWTRMSYPTAFLNNLIMTSFSILALVIFGSTGGYVCARKKSKVVKAAYLLFISCIIVPFQTAMIPLVQLINGLQLINTYFGIIIVYVGLGMSFTVFLYTGFIGTIPIELEEAAIVDGCSRNQIFLRIIFPMSAPTTATVIILNSLNIWNDLLISMLLMSNPARRNLVNSLRVFQGQYANSWSLIFAGVLLISLPVILLYVFLQKYIIAGVSAGSLKG